MIFHDFSKESKSAIANYARIQAALASVVRDGLVLRASLLVPGPTTQMHCRREKVSKSV